MVRYMLTVVFAPMLPWVPTLSESEKVPSLLKSIHTAAAWVPEPEELVNEADTLAPCDKSVDRLV